MQFETTFVAPERRVSAKSLAKSLQQLFARDHRARLAGQAREQARQSLRQALALAPQDGRVLLNLGSLFRVQNRLDEALGYYEQALALDPDHRGAHEYLGELFVELRQMDKARAQLAALDGHLADARARRLVLRELEADLVPLGVPLELGEGDFVVHTDHGIGRYQGLVTLDLGEGLGRAWYPPWNSGSSAYFFPRTASLIRLMAMTSRWIWLVPS